MANSVEQAVGENLTNDTTFMANFSAVYWQEVSKGVKPTVPYIVFWKVDDPGIETRLNKAYQGEARIQFDLWDTNKIRGGRLSTVLRKQVRDLNEISGGYQVMATGITEQTIQRQSTTDPLHFIVDGIIKWSEV